MIRDEIVEFGVRVAFLEYSVKGLVKELFIVLVIVFDNVVFIVCFLSDVDVVMVEEIGVELLDEAFEEIIVGVKLFVVKLLLVWRGIFEK